MDQIIFSQPDRSAEIIEKIISDGTDKLHLIADFDKTITKAFYEGEEIPSLISILRDGNHLTPDYAQKAHALFDKFHPIEIDPTVSTKEKKKAMEQWWRTHYELLIQSKLSVKDIESAVQSKKIQLREGFFELLNLLNLKNIPLVIISASGLGTESIRLYLEYKKCDMSNVYIISNQFIWDENGFATGIKEPIVHSLNKDEAAIKDFPFFSRIKSRKNVILLGDSPDDIEMVTGFDFNSLLKIGFLNKKDRSTLALFKTKYDLIVTGDGSLQAVNDIIEKV